MGKDVIANALVDAFLVTVLVSITFVEQTTVATTKETRRDNEYNVFALADECRQWLVQSDDVILSLVYGRIYCTQSSVSVRLNSVLYYSCGL